MAVAEKKISLGVKLADLWEKVGGVGKLVCNMGPGGTFQMTSADVDGRKVTVFKNLPAALGDTYRVWLKKFADNKMMVYEDEEYTYAEVDGLMDDLGAALAADFGIMHSDKVGIAMRNCPEFLIAFLGVTAMGAVAVPLNSLWNAQELEYGIKDAGCKVLFADPERLQLCAPFLGQLGCASVLCRGDAVMAKELGAAAMWGDVLASGKGKSPPSLVGIHPESEAMIMYTSGSTGFPKGVVHTQRSVGTNMKLGEMVQKVRPELPFPTVLLGIPLFHITALGLVFLYAVPAGANTIMIRKWDAGVALNVIEKFRVTRFTGVPTMIRDMLDHPDFSVERVSSMKNFAAGGAPVPPGQVKRLHAHTGKASSSQGYGLTEVHMATFNTGVDYLKRPTSCGRAVPLLVQLKVVDPETQQRVKSGERGELCIKSAMMMKGYHNKPEATAKAIDSEGFFHSGDIAKIEGGFVYILDRLKDLIIRGGENIDCSEVEFALLTHPSVRECSVFGLPDERLGEVVGTAVWIQGNPVTTAELSAHAASQLAKFKVPLAEHIFIHTEELPKGATGKLDKKGLRAKYSEAIKGPPASKL